MDTENRLRTPWEMKELDGWKELYSVYNCDGHIVASAQVKEVAELVVSAPDLLALVKDMRFTLLNMALKHNW